MPKDKVLLLVLLKEAKFRKIQRDSHSPLVTEAASLKGHSSELLSLPIYLPRGDELFTKGKMYPFCGPLVALMPPADLYKISKWVSKQGAISWPRLQTLCLSI